MSTPFAPELLTTFRTLAEVVYSGDSHTSVQESLCHAAVELVEGCDHASLMVSRHGRVRTAAASDDVALAADALELELGEGPCLDAIDDDEPDAHFCNDLRDGCRWPGLAHRLRADLGLEGMAGFRIRQDGQKVGALNIFSDTVGGLRPISLDQASLLSSFASVALSAADRGKEASTLRLGLESNREIGKAVGLLMAMHEVDADEAFGLLAKVSQEMNLKVADVAAQLISKHQPQSR
ncbi:GAF and ANTAR domain-containing protein [Nocardioides aequoreus]|uniref:GAF and ANTAR domain-containing protein n=1 Tax=Nocardioides aequoreus TaxID=397278 RepID=UPI000567646B|nr:GAF and ANTAR domain-containing protein [Nocardioides aequoreus]